MVCVSPEMNVLSSFFILKGARKMNAKRGDCLIQSCPKASCDAKKRGAFLSVPFLIPLESKERTRRIIDTAASQLRLH